MKLRKRQRLAGNVWKQGFSVAVFVSVIVCFGVVLSAFAGRSFGDFFATETIQEAAVFTSNEGLRRHVVQFLIDHNATELIPILKCESEFKHFENNGEVLRNHEGSSAIGVAQIMSSVHPDPQVLKRYNRKFDTNLRVSDFDITTVSGNLEYSLILYKLRGLRDWECADYVR